jgi:hypothetical protein
MESNDLVKIGPRATDLPNRFEYHLDFPGNALDAGCDYERWTRRLADGSEPTVYAHVATEAGRPGKLALQYWFFYTFNDFNNTHEGDWEMIQLVFDADDASEALEQSPSRSATALTRARSEADWEDDKLAVLDETHPVVYPVSARTPTSSPRRFISAAPPRQGSAATIRAIRIASCGRPSRRSRATRTPPLPRFLDLLRGRWGEPRGHFQRANRPEPEEAVDGADLVVGGLAEKSYAVPTGGLFGTGATDLFCTGVERGSRALVLFLQDPALVALVLAAVIALVAFVTIRATWTPVAPLRLGRRRSWGQILSASGSMYVRHPGSSWGSGCS